MKCRINKAPIITLFIIILIFTVINVIINDLNWNLNFCDIY